MAKQEATPAPKAQKSKVKKYLDQISEGIADMRKKRRQPLKIIAIAILLSAALISTAFGTAKFAFLYILANYGKLSGRMDGNVYKRNGTGRGFKVPALVRNGYTMTQRGILSTLSASFRGLTPTQIEAWNNLSYTGSNRFGQVITVRGKNAFVALNANLIDVGQSTLVDPPTFADVPAITSVPAVTMDASAGTMTFDFAPTPTDTNTAHLLFATKVLSPGISRPSKSAFRLIDIVPGGSTTPYDFASAYHAKFGAITGYAGSKVFIQLYAVKVSTGQKVPSVGASGVIVP